MSADGRLARDVMFGLMKTCQKLGISFVAYLGNCLGFNRAAARILQCPIWWAPDRRKFTPSRNLPRLLPIVSGADCGAV